MKLSIIHITFGIIWCLPTNALKSMTTSVGDWWLTNTSVLSSKQGVISSPASSTIRELRNKFPNRTYLLQKAEWTWFCHIQLKHNFWELMLKTFTENWTCINDYYEWEMTLQCLSNKWNAPFYQFLNEFSCFLNDGILWSPIAPSHEAKLVKTKDVSSV